MLQAYLSSSPTTSISEPACKHAHFRQEDSSNPTLPFHWKKAGHSPVGISWFALLWQKTWKEKAGLSLTVLGISVLCSSSSMKQKLIVMANQEAEGARLGPKTDIAFKAQHERDHTPKVSQPPGTASPLRTEQACGEHVIVKPGQDSAWSSHTAKHTQGNFKSPHSFNSSNTDFWKIPNSKVSQRPTTNSQL